MRPSLLSNRYAKAFAQATLKKGETLSWYGDLKNFSEQASKTPMLRYFLTNPGIPFSKKSELLDKLITVPLLRCFLLHLIKRNYLTLLPDIIERIQRLLDQEEGVLRAEVRSASALSTEQKEKLSVSLKDFFQNPILIEASVDPELLAGMVIRVGDTVLDNSLKSQLAVLERQLLAERP